MNRSELDSIRDSRQMEMTINETTYDAVKEYGIDRNKRN